MHTGIYFGQHRKAYHIFIWVSIDVFLSIRLEAIATGVEGI